MTSLESSAVKDDLHEIQAETKHAGKTSKFQCYFCHKTFYDNSKFILHKLTPCIGKPFSCEKCDKSFADRTKLHSHRRAHREKTSTFLCRFCSKIFTRRFEFEKHSKRHSCDTDFKCDMCDLRFILKKDLNSHIKSHPKENLVDEIKPPKEENYGRNHECDLCDKSFAYKSELKRHKQSHTASKPFSCDICYTSFARKSNLNAHRKLHDFGNEEYKCQVCAKSFSRKYNYQVHMKTHSGDTDFMCGLCEMTFVTKKDLTVHLRIHTGRGLCYTYQKNGFHDYHYLIFTITFNCILLTTNLNFESIKLISK